MIDKLYGEETLKDLLSRTESGKKILSKLSGINNDYPELLGKGFWKKVGKITRGITTTAAKIAAGAVGIPPSAIDNLAKVDPTAHKKLVATLATTPAGQKAQTALTTKKTKKDILSTIKNAKPIYLITGAAGLAAVIYLVTKKKK